MPRIPLPQSTGDVSVARQPRATVGIPVAPAPQQSLQAAGLAGEGLQQFGANLMRSGELLGQANAIEQQRLRAQYVLNAEEKKQTFIGQVQTRFDELRQHRDLSTLPEDLDRDARELIATMGADLAPGARPLFRAEAQQFLNLLLPKARDLRFQRQEEQYQFVALRDMDMARRALIEADDPETHHYWTRYLEGSVEQLVGAGLMKASVAAQVLGETEDEVAVGRVRRQMRLDPSGTLEALKEQAKEGKVDRIGNKPIADLIDEANAEETKAFNIAEARERVARRELEEEQMSRYTATLGDLNALWQKGDVAGILRWQQQLVAQQDQYRKEDFASGLGTATSLITGMQARAESAANRALALQERRDRLSDRKNAADLMRMVILGQGGMSDIQAAIANNKVNPLDDGLRIFNWYQQQQEKNTYSSVFEFKEGMQFLNQGITKVIGEFAVGPTDQFALERAQEAQHLYMSLMQQVHAEAASSGGTAEHGAAAVRENALPVARSLIERFTPELQRRQRSEFPKLSPALEAVFEAQGLQHTQAELQRQFQAGEGPFRNRAQAQQLYKDMVKNLMQREAINWKGGPPEPPPPAAAKETQSIAEWFKSWFPKGKTPLPPGGSP